MVQFFADSIYTSTTTIQFMQLCSSALFKLLLRCSNGFFDNIFYSIKSWKIPLNSIISKKIWKFAKIARKRK